LSNTSISIYPDVVITNPGLHDVWNSGNLAGYNKTLSEENMQKLFDMYESIRREETTYTVKPPLFLVHKVMAMTVPKYNEVIEIFNQILDNQEKKERRAGGGRGSRVRIIETYPLSQMLHKVSFCGKEDGIHFTRQCMYNPLLTQLDLNWMRYDGIIDDA
jgi:hypothetical protein